MKCRNLNSLYSELRCVHQVEFERFVSLLPKILSYLFCLKVLVMITNLPTQVIRCSTKEATKECAKESTTCDDFHVIYDQ